MNNTCSWHWILGISSPRGVLAQAVGTAWLCDYTSSLSGRLTKLKDYIPPLSLKPFQLWIKGFLFVSSIHLNKKSFIFNGVNVCTEFSWVKQRLWCIHDISILIQASLVSDSAEAEFSIILLSSNPPPTRGSRQKSPVKTYILPSSVKPLL